MNQIQPQFHPESAPISPTPESVISVSEKLTHAANHFLGNEKSFVSDEQYQQAIDHAEKAHAKIVSELEEGSGKREVMYDKYRKAFVAGDEKGITTGMLVAARHLGIEIALPKTLENSGDGKKVRKLAIGYQANDVLYENLNKSLAQSLADATADRDALKAKAYQSIADRSGIESRQLGVLAENIMIGVAEMIAIDRPSLGISVMPANAYQDVHEKIDFIIATTQKKRGVGIDGDTTIEEKHVGVQFTINTSQITTEHKLDQIAKSKARGVDVDDIVYVALDKKILQGAIDRWTNNGKPIAGPFSFLFKETQDELLRGMFHGVLTEEQEKSLLK